MKRMVSRCVCVCVCWSFPGLLGRGLIEATQEYDVLSYPFRTFPGLLGRGLIEATGWESASRSRAALPRSTGPGPH